MKDPVPLPAFLLGMPTTATPPPYSIQVSTDVSSPPYTVMCTTEIASSVITNYDAPNNYSVLPSQKTGFLNCNINIPPPPNPIGTQSPLSICNPVAYSARDNNNFTVSFTPLMGCYITEK